MPSTTGTGKKTPRSSLCKKVSFTVPTSWGELTQQQLRYILNLLRIYGEQSGGMAAVKMWALRYFCGFSVIRHTDDGWLCELVDEERLFLLADGLLPSMEEQVSWLEHPEDMTVRLEQVGEYKAVNMWLQQYPFGNYLALENSYQAYLQTREQKPLEMMFRLLYQVPDGADITFGDCLPLSVFLWFTAVKKRFASQFSHFLKPAGSGSQPGTMQSQYEMMQSQIRLLTKGDVTKVNQVMNADTWQALSELDALARESEEFNRKYGSNHV